MVRLSPPSWHLEYDVRNAGHAVLWLVVEESLVLERVDAKIELSYARGEMRPGVQVFGYFDPKVEMVLPGASLRRSVEIRWPCPLSDIWNSEREAAPPPGDYEVSIKIGFAPTAEPETPGVGESIEAPVLRWQRTTISAPIRLAVPPYKPAD
jgi:hypothetical protein